MPDTARVPHLLLTTHGSLPGGEQWSCGLRTLGFSGVIDGAAGAALAIAVSNRWRALANASKSTGSLFGNFTGSSAVATIAGTTVRRIDTAGKTVQQFEGSPTTALVAFSGISSEMVNYPDQTALAVTLVTERAGRTGKGRVYLPAMLNLGLAQDRIPGTVCTAIATGFSALVTGINTDLPAATMAGIKVAVMSGSAFALGNPVFPEVGSYGGAAVTAVRVGDALDTQRRRRSSVQEAYQTIQVT